MGRRFIGVVTGHGGQPDQPGLRANTSSPAGAFQASSCCCSDNIVQAWMGIVLKHQPHLQVLPLLLSSSVSCISHHGQELRESKIVRHYRAQTRPTAPWTRLWRLSDSLRQLAQTGAGQGHILAVT